MKAFTLAIALVLLVSAGRYAPAAKAQEMKRDGMKQEMVQTAERVANAPEMVALLSTSTVNRAQIHLGDLFAGTGDKADTPVAYAPDPGRRAIFDARWLYRLARAYGLKWRPLSLRDRAVVIRDSVVIGPGQIKEQILESLADFGVAAGMDVQLSNRLMRIHVAGDTAASLEVEDIVYSARTRRFTAILAAPAGDPSAQRYRVAGRVHEVQEAPVLVRRKLAGEIISTEDVKWTKIRTDRLQRNTILDDSGLIGMSVRRGLRAGVPVRTTDVRRPVLVPKGSLVTLILASPNMRLTSQGRAMENGSDGQAIRVTNTFSNTIIEGVVTGANLVTVRPANNIVMN